MKLPSIVGILNVTPDSYVDGGDLKAVDDVLRRVEECIQEGADIIEIGGESTGPGSGDVSLQEELDRVIPAVQAINEEFPDVVIAVDTWKSEVAAQSIEAGASMINDITAGRGDAKMFSIIAASGCSYVMMYSKDATARTTKEMQQYDDVVKTIHGFLEERIQKALQMGIQKEQIILDPGLGHFVSSDPQYSFEIIRRLKEFTDLGPIFVSPSRKSFLAGPKNLPVTERLPATLEVSLEAVRNGASFIRTHDVLETKNVLLQNK